MLCCVAHVMSVFVVLCLIVAWFLWLCFVQVLNIAGEKFRIKHFEEDPNLSQVNAHNNLKN